MIFLEITSLINKNLNRIHKLKKYKKKKLDDSYVSSADLFIENLINKYLKKKFRSSNYFLLSEENYNKSQINYSKYKNIFIIDPIDGTENFVSGIPIWGISLCWYKDNKHEDSLIYFPDLKQLITKKTKKEKNKSRIIAMSSSNNKLIKSIKNLNEIRITGCCVYNIYNVIHSRFKSYSNKKANVWDFIAGFNIAYENNIPVYVDGKKYKGEILQPDKKYSIEIKN
tara:strand:- start:119 stop:796 length:678 start_codon:yes stop_codon:yes gene_type:complete